MKSVRVLGLLILAALFSTRPGAHADEAEYQRIRQQMSKLAPLVGKWNVAATFHRKDGVIVQESVVHRLCAPNYQGRANLLEGSPIKLTTHLR
jgi:hypothetical protein